MKSVFEKPSCKECDVRFKTYFNILSDEDLRDLSIEKTCTLYKRNQTIYHEGTSPNGLYCVNSGKIKKFRNGENGKEQIIQFIAPGQLFGIKAVIEGSKYTTTTTAIEDSLVCFINNRKIFHLIMKYPNLTNYMLISLSRMLEEAETRMASIALKTVRQRVAESLLILVNTYKSDDSNTQFELRISREDLANSVGSATETVIRILKEFKEARLISINGRSIIVLDFFGLMKISNIDC
ncbi:MAG: Crp/Fnr family transcriptional regulator [Bacteroidetes bacterium]|jgi:CRP/FNR family transcriptional regulator, polysaccharide utilization system transcription regulator|nr:Crp/Fnr family transcriptional regulator [Bacteroidota bacterium]MBT5528184.1 Crp/Fnr family transcriptional regulator [Cytophagia bacterium]MBT3423343.1 Crp/Fnr family transcriptional regulator [Bacteroidota bacterium]MBT4338817.1 Crp/Fnr family transcriptional regulator [Bacteroidota bacterium]MBT4730115.1 Crp/Fnr family transcriptional regulator [Bacteroidota bacterium]